MDVQVVVSAVSGERVADRLDAIVEVYGAAFSLPPNLEGPEDVEEFAGRFPAHLQRPGFRFVMAIAELAPGPDDAGGDLVGFGYGYTALADSWWVRQVLQAIDEAVGERWLQDAFLVAEMAVRPSWQGRGIGGRLHDALLRGVPHRTGVLSTLDTESRGRTLYVRRGWHPLVSGFRFGGLGPAYTVMGLGLGSERARREW